MKLKILKACKFVGMEDELPVDSIVEVDDEQAKEACACGNAEEYTEEVENKEINLAIKQISTQETKIMSEQTKVEGVVSDNVKRLKDDPSVIGKAFRQMALDIPEVRIAAEQKYGTKAVAGMGESISGSGTELVVEGISQILGKVTAESEFLSGVRQVTMGDQQGSYRLLFETSDWWNASTAPTGETTAEGTALTPTKLTLGGVDVYPRMNSILLASTMELLEDVDGLTGEITRIATMKMPKILEGLALYGGTGAGGATGFAGILDASSASQVSVQTLASLAAPTVAEMQGFIAKIVPALRKNSKWIMSNAFWQGLQGNAAFVSAANINQMLINYEKQTLLGYPVMVVECMPASAPVIFGDPSQYCLVNARSGQQLIFSRELYFASNQLAWRLTRRVGGGIAHAKYTLADNSTVAAFCKASIQGS